MRDCDTNQAKWRELCEMFMKRKFDVLALSETELKGLSETKVT